MAGTPRERVAGAFDRLSTSYKLLILLSAALALPMLIALLAALQASRTASEARRIEYTALAEDGGATLRNVMLVDRRVVSGAINAIRGGADALTICRRLDEIMSSRQTFRPFALFGGSATPICASQGFSLPRPGGLMDDTVQAARLGDGQLLLTVVPPDHAVIGVVAYTPKVIGRLERWVLRAPGVYSMAIEGPGGELALETERSSPRSTRQLDIPLASDLRLRLTTAAPGATASDWLLAVVPILMWLAAAAIGFLVVDRALLRPLERLRAGLLSASKGQAPIPAVTTPAHEIRDLGDALRGYADDRAKHEGAINAALERQTALTREVHHRVKNNLQVIASLISLHSRATDEPAALQAFAAIQRRVDALAIVHRNHYAQSDEQGALELKPVLNELTANLLTNLPGARLTVQLPNLRVLLDTATALTFLVTEFVELGTFADIDAPIALSVAVEGKSARLTAQSEAFRPGEKLDELIERRYGRVMNGLVRQLRTELVHDADIGAYIVEFATLPQV